MRKRIDGHNYNTEKAIQVTRRVYDEDGFSRVLYRTRGGRYFVLELTGLPRCEWFILPIMREQAIQFLLDRELWDVLKKAFPREIASLKEA